MPTQAPTQDAPTIVNSEADEAFRRCAIELGEDPDSTWVGHYVEYEWNRCRHVFEHAVDDVAQKRALEFGCNLGATAIVLAHLGAQVTAVDIDDRYVELAKLNAKRYGVDDKIQFHHVTDTRDLPFETRSFDLVSCNSVLEYVPKSLLPAVMREVDRVVARGGLIFVGGTSNRLWPKEQHSGRWLINYLPSSVDRRLFGKSFDRGVFPWKVTRGFGDYTNTDLDHRGEGYLALKARMGASPYKLQVLRAASRALQPLRWSVGLLTPNISVTLRKP